MKPKLLILLSIIVMGLGAKGQSKYYISKLDVKKFRWVVVTKETSTGFRVMKAKRDTTYFLGIDKKSVYRLIMITAN